MEDALVIEQLGGARRRIELLGADAPDAGVETGIEQRLTTQWAPGAARPVVQVLGAKRTPMTLRGLWNGAQSRYESVIGLVQSVEAIVRDGVAVRLVWGTTWSREGLVSKFVPRWEMTRLVGWEIDFEVHADGASSAASTQLRAIQARADVNGAAAAMRAAALSALAARKTFAAAMAVQGVDP